MRILLISDSQDRANNILVQLYVENLDQIDTKSTRTRLQFKDGTIICAASPSNLYHAVLSSDYDQIFVTRLAHQLYYEHIDRAVGHVLRRSCVPAEYVLVELED